jgi:predicted  nucleic acid-binding Zn-ribbon protein
MTIGIKVEISHHVCPMCGMVFGIPTIYSIKGCPGCMWRQIVDLRRQRDEALDLLDKRQHSITHAPFAKKEKPK